MHVIVCRCPDKKNLGILQLNRVLYGPTIACAMCCRENLKSPIIIGVLIALMLAGFAITAFVDDSGWKIAGALMAICPAQALAQALVDLCKERRYCCWRSTRPSVISQKRPALASATSIVSTDEKTLTAIIS